MAEVSGYSAMRRQDLETLRDQKMSEVAAIQKEVRKLRKKFKTGFYDRQVICEYIISLQGQSVKLTESLDRINNNLAH